MDTFAKRLREARESTGHTQESFAEAIGMIRTNYVPYETGKKLPALDVIPRIAKGLGLSPYTLFEWIAQVGTDQDKALFLKQFKPEIIIKAYERLVAEDPEKYQDEAAEIRRRVKERQRKR